MGGRKNQNQAELDPQTQPPTDGVVSTIDLRKGAFITSLSATNKSWVEDDNGETMDRGGNKKVME